MSKSVQTGPTASFLAPLAPKTCLFALSTIILTLTVVASGAEYAALVPDAPGRLPRQIDDRPVLPDFGCFWSFSLEGDDYKKQIDAIAPTNAFDVLGVTLRNLSFFDNNEKAVAVTREAVEYAKEKYGIATLLDLDLRIARYDFEKKRPELAQERLFFQKAETSGDAQQLVFSFETPVLTDHYAGSRPYYVRGGRVVKAWAYRVNDAGEIEPTSIQDVASLANWNREQFVVENKPGYEVDSTLHNKLEVSFDKSKLPEGISGVTVAAAFRYSYPDLFADETFELEKRLFELYRDVPTLGGYKDEWGFPPNFDRNDALNDFWYSDRMAQAYAARFDGRSLVDDLFLAYQPQSGKAKERVDSVDRFRRLCADRVVEHEYQSYRLNKEIWGPDAFVGVHCTWFPWPNTIEMRKNGIMWWKATRDIAQTDEYTPFCVRNSLAKGCGSLWLNMFYARQTPAYVTEHWTAASSGGRVHIHSIYPRDENSPKNEIDPRILPIVGDAGVNRIREKIRMLNLVSNSPVDSPIAVVFGRLGAANPLRPEYRAIGVELCDLISTKGYPADLIPVDEIFTKGPDGAPRWSVKDNRLAYGDQKYDAILLYGENEVEMDAWDALRALGDGAPNCKTQLIYVPASATQEEKEGLATLAIEIAEALGAVKQTPWLPDESAFSTSEEVSVRPPRTALSRYIDGTILWIAATESDFGDQILLNDKTIALNDRKNFAKISVDANGVFAIRFDAQGQLDAVVAAEVKSLNVGELSLTLSEEEIGDDPIDVAIWRDSSGAWRGVFQRKNNELPETLQKLVPVWNYLKKV
ncbi:MAG: hypothetical protein ACOX0A_05030 [Thermoguttaceae bacterium]|jgi:hypothetical protein